MIKILNKTKQHSWLSILLILIIPIYLLISCHLDSSKPKPTPTTLTPSGPTNPPSPTKPQDLVWSGGLEFYNKANFKKLLRVYKICDPCTSYTGPLDCDNFDDSAEISIKFEKTDEFPAKAYLTIQTQYTREYNDFPLQLWFGICQQQIPGMTLNPQSITMEGTAQHWNNYYGFHIRFKGSNSITQIIIRSEETNPTEFAVLDVNIYYGNSTSNNTLIGRANLSNPSASNLYQEPPTTRR